MKKIILTTAIAMLSTSGCVVKSFNGTPDTNTKPSIKVLSHSTFHYTCTKGATVTAKYNSQLDNVMLIVNAPSWKLTNQVIEMDATPSASGSLFVNNTNPSSLYAWHTKANEGMLSVTIRKKEYVLNCKMR